MRTGIDRKFYEHVTGNTIDYHEWLEDIRHHWVENGYEEAVPDLDSAAILQKDDSH